jgi:EpsI family protein
MNILRLSLCVLFLALPWASSLLSCGRATDLQLDEYALQELQPTSYIMRNYADADGSVELYAAFYSGYDDKAAHDPHVCYPAQGFDIHDTREERITLPSGEVLHVWLFRARLDQHEQVVAHWFQPMGRWTSQAQLEPWVRMLRALRGNKSYAFVRIAAPVVDGDTRAAQRTVEQAVSEVAPWARRILEEGAAGALQASVRESTPDDRPQPSGQ